MTSIWSAVHTHPSIIICIDWNYATVEVCRRKIYTLSLDTPIPEFNYNCAHQTLLYYGRKCSWLSIENATGWRWRAKPVDERKSKYLMTDDSTGENRSSENLIQTCSNCLYGRVSSFPSYSQSTMVRSIWIKGRSIKIWLASKLLLCDRREILH